MLMRLGALAVLCLAGPLWAGETAGDVADQGLVWVAEYQLHDAQGDRTLVVARDEKRVEYRTPGEPIRAWQQGSDGVVHRQIFPADRKVVVYTPGDLRALGHVVAWPKLSGLVDPTLLDQMQAVGDTRIAGEAAQRYRGAKDGLRIELSWLSTAALPAHYQSGRGKGRFELTLRKLERRAADEAFTATDEYRELDFADIGDMELDPFAKRYILQGF
ncbi:hypothetical protein [Montanilutibacter psychrotolerans]|uniref:Outer membrane lipoprotein-sorting protein n=1 Tax=Montanilutibacter psychrotolerans TaxID=1327343 RepID=A0A3M8T3Y4_9GAMM|nr:hypothetical protein [Lysobacter psychrotolerans]RNF86184.1 hypothetical protein EER27_01800 [Lysobacter psychrotolerans]